MIEYGRNTLGREIVTFDPVTIGFPSRERIGQEGYPGTVIGSHAVLRTGTMIYCEVLNEVT